MHVDTLPRGVMPLVPTPFDDDDRVDERSLRNLIDHYVAAGAHGLTLLGVASEVLKLDDAECLSVVDIAMDQAAGRVPVVIGTGYPSTRVAVRRSQAAQAAGAVAVLVLPPYAGPRPGADALVEYFGAVASSVSIPVVVLDEPASSLVDLPVALLKRLADDAGVHYVKAEAVPTARKMAELRALGLEVFGGSGGLYFVEELAAGSLGAMTGFSFIEVLVDVFNAWEAGDRDQATRLFDRYLPPIRYEMQQGLNLQLRKQVLQWRGIIATARVRGPADPLDAYSAQQMRDVVDRVGLRWAADSPYVDRPVAV
jgi:4-hydroxy-tetrahydrodipicolinate synthase